MSDPLLDDIDRVFARVGDLEAPEAFFERVMVSARASELAHEPVRSRLGGLIFALAYFVAMVGLALLAYSTGAAIVRNGTNSLIGVLIGDLELFSVAPSAYLGAIAASIPWLHLLGVAGDLAVLAVVTRFLLRPARGHSSGFGLRSAV